MAGLTTIKLRRGTASAWTSANPVLASGEMGYETDTVKLKIGDGSTAWNSLAYMFSNGAAPADGWVDDSAETWTYASFTAGPPALGTFTIPGDVRAKYTIGTRIKLTQTTVKYFVVIADPTFSGGNTTVSVSGGTDYTLANAAITNNAHSYVESPQGYPGWFNCAAGLVGWSSVTVTTCRFYISGRLCTYTLNISAGTANNVTTTATLPIAPGPSASAIAAPFVCVDSNTTLASPGRGICSPGGGTTLTFQKDYSGASMGGSGSGTKRIIDFLISYEI